MIGSVFAGIGKVLRVVWIFLGVCLLTVVLAEIGGRIAYNVVDAVALAIRHKAPPAPTPCERVMASLTLRWQPFTYWRGQPSHNDLVTVEADGRRRNWNAPAADSTAPRVVVTGGSAVWGMCVRDDETIPSYVSRRLADTGTRAWVENHAQIGWVTSQEWMDLTLDLRAGRTPRVVVFYDGWNDIVAGMAEGSPGIPLNEANREKEFNLLLHPGRMRLYSIGNPMNSALGRFATALRRRLGGAGARRPAAGIPSGWARVYGADTSAATLDRVAHEVVRVYEWNVSHVEELGRLYGFRPLFYWQPDLVGKTGLAPLERKSLAEDPLMVRFTGRVHAAVRESAVLNGRADFRDLEGVFDGDEQEIFYDWCHVTAAANQRIAETLAADVARALGEPGAQHRAAAGR